MCGIRYDWIPTNCFLTNNVLEMGNGNGAEMGSATKAKITLTKCGGKSWLWRAEQSKRKECFARRAVYFFISL